MKSLGRVIDHGIFWKVSSQWLIPHNQAPERLEIGNNSGAAPTSASLRHKAQGSWLIFYPLSLLEISDGIIEQSVLQCFLLYTGCLFCHPSWKICARNICAHLSRERGKNDLRKSLKPPPSFAHAPDKLQRWAEQKHGGILESHFLDESSRSYGKFEIWIPKSPPKPDLKSESWHYVDTSFFRRFFFNDSNHQQFAKSPEKYVGMFHPLATFQHSCLQDSPQDASEGPDSWLCLASDGFFLEDYEKHKDLDTFLLLVTSLIKAFQHIWGEKKSVWNKWRCERIFC